MYTIDIVIPVYNNARNILDSISSAISQKNVIVNCIVINDGSTDGVKDILKNSPLWGNFQYIENKKNMGVSSARNEGIKNILSEYCCFLDSDDILNEEYSITMINFLRKFKFDIGYCDAYFVEEYNTERILKINNYFNKDIRIADLLCGNQMFTPTVCFKTAILNDIKFNESLKYNEDWLFWIELANSSIKNKYHKISKDFNIEHFKNEPIIGFLNKKMVKIRTRKDGLTSKKHLINCNYCKAIKIIEEKYGKYYYKELKNAKAEWANRLCSFGELKKSVHYFISSFPSRKFLKYSYKIITKYFLFILGIHAYVEKKLSKNTRNSILL